MFLASLEELWLKSSTFKTEDYIVKMLQLSSAY